MASNTPFTAAALRRWADARERRNTPGGHGSTGTALLRQAAEELDDAHRMFEQFCRDLNQAHDEIVRLQGGDPAKFDWPVWSPQANSIRWAEDLLGKPLAKARSDR